MKAGRELDALIAERVMGWGLADDGAVIIDGAHLPCPRFSEDIAAAWEVVEHLPKLFQRLNPATDGFLIETHMEQGLGENGAGRDYYVRFEFESRSYDATADTLPLAVCLAAREVAERK